MSKLRQQYDDLKERYGISDITISVQSKDKSSNCIPIFWSLSKIYEWSIFTIWWTFTGLPQHLSEVASQLGYSSVDSVTLEDMVLEVSQQYWYPWHRQSCMCLYFGHIGTSPHNFNRIQPILTPCTFSPQIVRQIERLIRAKEMMEAAGKPF